MNLLFITRKLDENDDAASFVIGWVSEFSRQLSSGNLFVICQELGEVPRSWGSNIIVHSLGKEKGFSRFRQLLLFQKHLLNCVPRTDGVFAHMIQHYSIIAGPYCFFFRKPLYQWYMHKKVGFLLRLASLFVDGFVTASIESFRLRTKKPVYITGHGINVEKFSPKKSDVVGEKFSPKFLSVGRISPVKNIHVIVEAMRMLLEAKSLQGASLEIIGGLGLSNQNTYLKQIESYISDNALQDEIHFLGPLSNEQVVSYYQRASVSINLSDTGSLDKVTLEAMACGTPVLTSNEAFKDILPEKFFLSEKDPASIAKRLEEIVAISKTQKQQYSEQFREYVVKNHNLRFLVRKILDLYESDMLPS